MSALGFPAKNPMASTTLSVLVFEAIVFGLAIPGVIFVEHRDAGSTTLWCGIAIALALLGAIGLRRGWGWIPAWAAQVAGIALGWLTPMMYFIGLLFALLFVTCVVLGRRLEARRPTP